jgi:hypothetical protein
MNCAKMATKVMKPICIVILSFLARVVRLMSAISSISERTMGDSISRSARNREYQMRVISHSITKKPLGK